MKRVKRESFLRMDADLLLARQLQVSGDGAGPEGLSPPAARWRLPAATSATTVAGEFPLPPSL